jgi:steroid 5-alpha reductase family enzyme
MWLALILILGYFYVFFLVGTIIKNNSIVDIGWGLGFVVVSWALFVIEGTYHTSAIVMNVLVSLWGLRLFYHILKRNLFQEEDFRYQAWRKAWGKWVIPRAFLQVYTLQGLFMFVIGLSAYYINVTPVEFSWWSLVGVGLWAIGYAFEVIGDAQLKRHLKTNKGVLMTKGLWSVTRHPNYFGDFFMWVGLFVYAVILGGPWYLVVSPVAMAYVFVFVSIPLLEERMKKRDGWDAYAERTASFLPWIG